MSDRVVIARIYDIEQHKAAPWRVSRCRKLIGWYATEAEAWAATATLAHPKDVMVHDERGSERREAERLAAREVA